MDYDGSDTQGHNIQLTGEGRSKSSSVPRPFAFPRFEFEDSLQGHLRFDSIVESEAFLGIQSQEDNQWIEDFSRESNVIQFSSSATESCSITGRNDVWSEATSLESVELLLKSVGQEQTVPKDTVGENSNTINELGDLTKNMEPKFEHDNVNSGYTRISDASMPQDEQLNNLSGSENHVEEKTEGEEITLSQTYLVQKQESSSQMCVDILEEDCGAPVTEGDLVPGTERDDNSEGVQFVVHKSMSSVEDGSSHTPAPTEDISFNPKLLGSSQSPDQASSNELEGAGDLIRVAVDDAKKQFSSQHTVDDASILDPPKVYHAMHPVEVPHDFSLSVECLDKGNGAEVIINSNESTAISCMQDTQFQLPEGVGKDNSLTSPAILGEGQTDILSASAVTKLNIPNAEIHSSSESKMDSVLQLNQKLGNDKVDTVTESSHKEGGSGGDIPGILSPSSLIRKEEGHTTDKIKSANIVDTAESLSFPVSSSSVESTKEIGGVEIVKDLHNASTVIVEGSEKGFEEEAELQLSTVHGSEDISYDAKKEEDIRLCTDVIDKSSETCIALISERIMGSSTIMESPSNDELLVNQPQPDIMGNTEPETNFIPCKRSDDHVEKEGNEAMHEQPFGRESSNADDKGGSGARVSVSASLLAMDSSDQVTAEVGSSCKAKFDTCHDSSASQLSDAKGKFALVMETSNTASGSDSQTVIPSDCSKGLEVPPDCDASLTNKGNFAEGFLSDSQKVACNSPTMVSSDVQILDERKQEGVGGSVVAESKPSTSKDLKVKDASGDDTNFTFKVDSLPDVDKEKTTNWTPFPIAAMHKSSVVLEGVTTPDVDKIHYRLPPETSAASPGELSHVMSKTTSGRKRRASGKGATKESSQTGGKGKETTPDKPSRKRGKVSSVPLSPSSSLAGQFVGLQPHGFTDQKSKKLSTMAATPSDLPDLNASALKNHVSPSTAYQQPFTDMQQVQLRAQIFVYGSLIQGTAPDEACMVSAFGPSGRERSVWEPVWLAVKERAHSKKSHSTVESPMNSHSTGSKVSEATGKQVTPQTKVFQTPVSRAGSKTNPTTILSPIIPLSSPLWSISTPYHDVSQLSNQPRTVLDYQPATSPLHPYQIPSVRNIIGHSTWPSPAPSPSPWAPQTSPLIVSAPFTTTQVGETVKLTPLKEKDLSLPASSCVKDAPSTPLVPAVGPSTLLAGSSQLSNQTKGTLSSELTSPDPKPRRRKKSQASNDILQNSLLSQSRTEPIVASHLLTPAASNSQSQTEPIVASPLPTPAPLAAVTIPTCHVTTPMADVFPACSTPQQKVGHLDVGAASACSKETLGKVADAKLQAEEAAVLAATAISHWEGLWSQLAKQEPGTVQEAEVKIAAAAGAAAAAACVAKAAAAAARVASNAALQAKLMADEALVPSRTVGGAQTGNLISNVHNIGSSTPASILTGDGGSNQSGSILVAAREAAKRRIEAASAAAKQAENLDAIVKAAELAAEAVSQAGKIVAMGESLPLKELINAGPEGYLKLSQGSSKLVPKSGDGNKEQISEGGAALAMVSSKEHSGPSGVKGSEVTEQVKIHPGELLNCSFDDNVRRAHLISGSIGACEKDLVVGKSHEASDMVQGDSSGAGSGQDEHKEHGIVQGNDIKEGSIVEVYKDTDGLKPAWFSASVMSLHDGKAFVQYTRLLSKEGRDTLKEWVALEVEGGNAPRIRLHWQEIKKRRRSAMGNYTWTVGDMVDVSIQDSWWEGIVTEKNEKDATTLTVHFPARGETSAVSVQQLRPTRIWSNGRWVERSISRVDDQSTESDMPLEKRPRRQSPSSSKGEQAMAEAETVVGKPEESKLLALSAGDKVFNVGRSTKVEAKPDLRRTLRTGLPKEKSRVVFGVPKPGKRQKFMEVSKHFPADQNKKANETKDPVKFAKYLMPQGAASRGRKNQPRVDSKEKQASKIPTTKSRSAISRAVPQKDNFVSSASAETPRPGKDVDKSDVHEENTSKMEVVTGSSSGIDEAAEGPLSSLLANQLDGSFKKSSSIKTELLNKGKQVQFGGQLAKVAEERVHNGTGDKTPAEAGEPRRSNRRIQPTHRLLEGLQSSLVIPKMPSVSHDKSQGQKNRGKSTSTRGKWL